MPIYEYECLNCGEHFEVMQKFSDKPIRRCPHCGEKVHKLISRTSFILKGSGWYATDYASSERKRTKQDEGTTDTKSESKVDAAPKK